MAEQEQVAPEVQGEEEEENPNYKPPAPKALDEIVSADAEDESLRKYKEALLGGGLAGNVIVDPNNEKKVIVQKLSLLAEGRDEIFIDLTRPEDEIKKECFTLKEGCKYQIKIYFYVQREIVSGLRYEHKVYRKGISVDKMKQMMGSYGPKTELQSFTTQTEDAPSGLLMRGDYKIKSRFVDDDQNEYVTWEWHLAVKKDW
ncbi:rho GDP-dissociation inhibitor 1 [Aplysia californica]|uniref:Rho GDP-dissociation inhibitor 1 n=1 Tax=Aplysia californica TaxID=6500 RepID=A0ABM0JMT1_APLCA|nr:rho GDP-dissociation inhibitor 1 [Aplysia californica]XP_035825405.1 rho GDP-dissociation inhibitor 1 [Aplysia californica]